MKKRKWIGIIALVIVLAVVAWYFLFRRSETIIALQTEKVVAGTLSQTVTATGTVQPVDTVAVGTQVSGTIKAVYADFNSTVKKGQLLAQLDQSLLQAQLSQYLANLGQAEANYTFQQSNYERQRKLHDVGAVSQAELESAKYQWESAKDNVNSIKAQVASAKRNLSFTDIYSPIEGTVLSRSVSEGQTVAASFSTPTLFSIAKDLTKMQVQASVDEADIGNVQQGQPVVFTVDAFPSDTFSGIVKEVRLQSSVSANVVTYTTIIEAPNEFRKLKPGMTASVVIYTKVLKDVLVVPASALNFEPDIILHKKYQIKIEGEPGGQQLWIKKDSALIRRSVRTGMTDDTRVQIVNGVNENDEVITGYTGGTVETKASGTSSPFMPKPPSGSNRKNMGPPQ